jgi:hypothetical protein
LQPGVAELVHRPERPEYAPASSPTSSWAASRSPGSAARVLCPLGNILAARASR